MYIVIKDDNVRQSCNNSILTNVPAHQMAFIGIGSYFQIEIKEYDL